MLNPPKTYDEAVKHKYDRCAARPNGKPYNSEHCAWEIFAGRGLIYQCTRSRGFGPGCLYCRQHTKKVEK